MSVVTSSNPRFDVEGAPGPVGVEGNKSSFGKKALLAAVGVVAIVGAAVAAVTLSGKSDSSSSGSVEIACGNCMTPAIVSDNMQLLTQIKLEQKAKRHSAFKSRGGAFKSEAAATCSNGMAGSYPCKNIDLLSTVSIPEMGGRNGDEGNDIWGWVDPQTQKEYALVGLERGMSVVDVTNPTSPVPLIFVPGATSTWHDVKVNKNYAYIVSEGRQGMQIFDLTQVRGVTSLTTMEATLVYRGPNDVISTAHNVAINEDTDFAYIVGARSSCGGGIHAVDISNPLNPTFAGCVGSDGYTHDVHCQIYSGPDSEFTGKEICYAYNEDTVTIFDATDKQNVEQLSRFGYSGAKYVHQGWTTPDQKYILIDDELDEERASNSAQKKTRTIVANIENLRSPQVTLYYRNDQDAIDHNLYTKGAFAYCSNYGSGLRVVDLTYISDNHLTEVAYFDVSPESSTVEFKGSWSSYIYFPSGNIVVSSIERGLFVLKPNLPAPGGNPPTPPTEQPTPAPQAGPVPPPGGEWICNPDYYGAGDGCDCGCGKIDPDCESSYSSLYCDGPAGNSKSTWWNTCDLTQPNGGKCVSSGWGR